MHINFPWKFHQNVFTLTITFIVLNVSTELVLIYRPHPVHLALFIVVVDPDLSETLTYSFPKVIKFK